jgi:MoaA/NifB/PqqE/SkfB family radical SAM enzyme/glycosyltransferase involved in cell wall biosynthesis
LTRSDLFPPNHGAAVKIIQTAKHLATNLRQPCFVVTADKDHYWKIDKDVQQCVYPKRWRAMQEWLFLPMLTKFADRICETIGYPEEEYFLYSAQFDPAWVIRAITIGLEENIDVFQAEFPGYGLVAALVSRIIATIKLGKNPISSIVQHNVEWDRLREFGHDVERIKRMELFSLHAVHEVIAVSQDDKQRMVESGIASDKITVIPHGVDCTVMREGHSRRGYWREHWGIKEQELVLFFHGTLHYWPNTEAVRFIAEDLITILEGKFTDYRIVITGMNPPLYYEHPRIIFTEAVEDLAGHIHMADICLCPLFSGGGTRLKLLEYMAANKPIITTKKGAEGIPYHSQFLYAETAEEFLSAIQQLRNTDIKPTLIQNARTYVASLDWSMVTNAYIDLYSGLDRGENWNEILYQKVVDIEVALPTRKKSKPLTMLLMLNNGCNLRCSFCDLWEHYEFMPVNKLLRILEDAKRIGTKTVVITGGEPLLHPDLYQIVSEAKRLGMTINITTNGTLVEKKWEELVQCGIDSLSFSLDGIGSVHDEIRGQKGAFDRTLQALDRVRSETDIDCNVYFVATNKNVHQLWDVYELSKERGARFDFWPVNDAPELYLKTSAAKKMWLDTVTKIIDDDPSFASRRLFYEEGLQYHQGKMDKLVRCLGFVDQYGITYKGEFLPCCVWQGKGLVKGNVFQRSLYELWFSSEIQQYRKELVGKGCDVGCFNHSLYEFTDSTGLNFRVLENG